QTPTAPSTGAPEVANSGTDGSTVAGNATGAMASELAGTDYTGAYDSGGTADYSGGYATDFGAGDASCACS
ncbi:MAG TPA: hypothetical protein VF486_25465, partial [Actinomycetes bacterium]